MRKALCVAAALLIAVNFAYSQDDLYDFGWYGLHNIWGMNSYYDFNASGLSARSMGMGGLYYTLDNEGLSSYLNPAGMVYTQKALMSVGVLSSFDTHKGAPFQIDDDEFYDTETGLYLALSQNDVDRERVQIDNAGAVAPFYYFGREWWAGLGYRKDIDLFAEYSLPLFTEGNVLKFTQHGSVDAVNGGLATRLIPQLSVGMNMNIFVRGYTQEIYYSDPYIDEYNDTLYTDYHLKDKSNFSGINFDFGAIVDLDMFRVALNISTPLTLTQDVTYTREEIEEDGQTDGYIDRLTAKNKYPATFGGGVAFTPNDQLTVGVDITHKPYSKLKIDIDPEQTAYSNITDYDPEWEDLTQFRIGAEYVLDFASFDIPLRAGFMNIPIISKECSYYSHMDSTSSGYSVVYDSTVTGDQYNTYVFSIGTGLKFEKIWFDIAYQFGSSDFDQGWYIDDSYGTDKTYDLSNEYAYSRLYISASMLF